MCKLSFSKLTMPDNGLYTFKYMFNYQERADNREEISKIVIYHSFSLLN